VRGAALSEAAGGAGEGGARERSPLSARCLVLLHGASGRVHGLAVEPEAGVKGGAEKEQVQQYVIGLPSGGGGGVRALGELRVARKAARARAQAKLGGGGSGKGGRRRCAAGRAPCRRSPCRLRDRGPTYGSAAATGA